MDAFYASVEQRDRPELRGRPVIVGGALGRGVVSAASYEARRFGVHSAMPMTTARRLCPQAVVLPVRMKHYAQISRQIREIFFAFTPLVEPLSLDEAFLDVRGCEGLFGPAVTIARQIKERIKSDTGLTPSVGVAPNKYLAKLASDVSKPDGFIVLPADQVAAFVEPLPVSRIWGVGARGERRLRALGIHTMGQLAALPQQVLIDHFGEHGRHVWQLARGQDDRTVVPDRDAKSISTETTFSRDVGNRQALRTWLLGMVDHVAARLRQEGLHARTLEVKIRSTDFRTWTRSQTLAEATNLTEVLWQAAAELFERSLSREMLPVRLLGVGASRLAREGTVQGQLFEADLRRRQTVLDQAIDAIRGRFGAAAIKRASLYEPSESADERGA
jgi:DNA polymerase-4